jgi:hypothetical protein
MNKFIKILKSIFTLFILSLHKLELYTLLFFVVWGLTSLIAIIVIFFSNYA